MIVDMIAAGTSRAPARRPLSHGQWGAPSNGNGREICGKRVPAKDAPRRSISLRRGRVALYHLIARVIQSKVVMNHEELSDTEMATLRHRIAAAAKFQELNPQEVAVLDAVTVRLRRYGPNLHLSAGECERLHRIFEKAGALTVGREPRP
jgi:hypothetical protein